MKKDDFRKEIQEAFLETLKNLENDENAGGLWTTPWFCGAMPQNGKTKRKYNGINQAYLRYRQNKLKSNDPRWFTFNQIVDAKGLIHKGEKWKLKKGEKGSRVEYWFPYDLIEKKKISWEEFKERDRLDCTIFPTYQVVFNGSQIEGIGEWKEDLKGTTERSDVISLVSKGMNVPIYEDQENRAYYTLDGDCIHLPKPGLFKTKSSYDATALHELCHATGNSKRLNRSLGKPFGSPEYAYEELIAEIGSCYCMEYLDNPAVGLELNNSKAYISSWIKSIEEKPEALFKAFKEAEKASDYIGNIINANKEGEGNHDSI